MKQLLPLLSLSALILSAGCKPESSAPPVTTTTNQTYSVSGVVEAIPPDHRHATIKNEKIPGYMAAMTMDFSVRDTNALNGIAPGDKIDFTLVVTADDDWIENIHQTGKAGVTTPPGRNLAEPELSVGDTLPDYEFLSAADQPVRFSDFRGSAVAFTFFFTSCPLPEYCPRMNRNFSEARKLLSTGTNAVKNWEMLSISFDSSFDTPQVLSSYAKLYRGDDTNHWLFAVASTNTLASLAPKVDLNFWRVNGSISHNLRTVVMDGSGKITDQFDGNDWTPQQLADAIRKAALPSKP